MAQSDHLQLNNLTVPIPGNIDDKRWFPVSSSAGNLNSSATMVTRAALTLWCHYYLEGGWGWVVLSASVLSTMLTSGCHWTIVDYLSHSARPPAIAGWNGPSSTLQKGRRT